MIFQGYHHVAGMYSEQGEKKSGNNIAHFFTFLNLNF